MRAEPHRSAEELIAEGAAVPLEGWDFSWFAGRASEERPSWGYALLLAERLGTADAAVDLQTGGGEVFSFALGRAVRPPERLAATESFAANRSLATRRLAPFGVSVVAAADAGPLPFDDGAFDLVSSRHPVVTPWSEIARLLRPGGVFFSQQVGAGSNRELSEFMLGPQPVNPERQSERAVAAAAEAGLIVVDLREEQRRVEFGDVGAVVHFLRKVLWTVPGFTVDAYRERLLAIHEHICREGSFTCRSVRFLIEARRPE